MLNITNVKKIELHNAQHAYEMLLNNKYLVIAFDTIEYINDRKLSFLCSNHEGFNLDCEVCAATENYVNIGYSEDENEGLYSVNSYRKNQFYHHYNEVFDIDELVETINKKLEI